MRRAEAVTEWRRVFLPMIREAERVGGVPPRPVPDYPARSESWGIYTDGLHRDGRITQRQYEGWAAPSECSPKPASVPLRFQVTELRHALRWTLARLLEDGPADPEKADAAERLAAGDVHTRFPRG